MRQRVLAVEVAGDSMLPALRPGDRLLVRTGAAVREGHVVVAHHPDKPQLMLVKRATHRDGAGWWLESDNQRAQGRRDSWDFGAVPDPLVIGPAVLRYWPPSRLSFSLTGPRSTSAPSRRRSR